MTSLDTAGIRQVPGAVPLLGHTVSLVRDPLKFLRSLPAHGDLVSFRVGPVPVVAVCTPTLANELLLDDRVFDKGGIFYDKGRETVGNGLATSLSGDHRRQRRMLQPAFHKARIPGYAKVMVEQIAACVGSWHDGQVIDPQEEMQRLTGNIIMATMFANSVDDASVAEMIDDLNVIQGRIIARMIAPALVNRLATPGNRRYDRAQHRLRLTIQRIIAAYRSHPTRRDDLLSMLLAAHDPGAQPPERSATAADAARTMSDDEVADQVVSFFIAGVESAAATLAWALHMLAEHPAAQQRLRDEADAVLTGGGATFDDLPRLAYTTAVVTEAMRLYPTGWFLTRVAVVDGVLGGHPIPAGTTVLFSPYLLHHRSPGTPGFDPDRWIDTEHVPTNRNAFFTFGGGPRKCIGDGFAMAEMVLMLATVAKGWEIGHSTRSRIRPARRGILSPRGARLTLHARPVS